MQSILWADCKPENWLPDAIPDVDDVRPPACPRCKAPARDGTRIQLQGHGRRDRAVVIRPTIDGQRPEIGDCWARRYRCVCCEATLTVLPVGVFPRCLYSALAIVAAFLATAPAPLGDGLEHRAAYARHAMFPNSGWTRPGPLRWRSLDRWARRAADWWPDRPHASLHALIAGWYQEAGGVFREVLARAVASHPRWGAAM